MCSGPRVNVGQKRHIEESSDSILDDNNTSELIRLKKKCLEIEKRVEVLETTWMRTFINCNCIHFINVSHFFI